MPCQIPILHAHPNRTPRDSCTHKRPHAATPANRQTTAPADLESRAVCKILIRRLAVSCAYRRQARRDRDHTPASWAPAMMGVVMLPVVVWANACNDYTTR
jgi:hypothetical protein